MLRFVRGALADAGYDALVTGDDHDLAALIDAERPHLVLLDLMLSTYDALLRQVWRERETADTDLVRVFIQKLRRKLGNDPRRSRPTSSTTAASATAWPEPS